MTLLIIQDGRRRPDLFLWNGATRSEDLTRWLQANQLEDSLPSDLIAFWRDTGGGDIYETQTILGPFAADDDVTGVNEWLRQTGMPEHFLGFHTGLCLSAIDLRTRQYVTLNEQTFEVVGRFESFNAWYQMLRDEYAARYGL